MPSRKIIKIIEPIEIAEEIKVAKVVEEIESIEIIETIEVIEPKLKKKIVGSKIKKKILKPEIQEKIVKLEIQEKVKKYEEFTKDIVLLDSTSIQILDTWIKNIELNVNSISLEQLNNYSLNINKFNTNLIFGIEHLMNYSDKIIELNNLIIKNQTKLNNKSNKKFNNLDELIDSISNQDQIKRLQKILPDNKDYAKVYLQGWTDNTDIKKSNLLGTIKILGQYNFQKKERESYEIKVMTNEPTTFWCSCIDHKLNSSKRNTVCKHISFIVCKVIKVLELYFFDSKVLSTEHLQLLLTKISNKSDLWTNKDLVRDIKQITLDTFKIFPTIIDDVCTFCYDSMSDVDKPISLCCPSCKHCFHSECMDIWLENYSRCTICSSDFWKHYFSVKKGDIIDVSTKL